ncbi:small terminase subunit [Pseudomonas phage Achelous]|uniref:Small terminase subunit n=1 Tax=Pseudomonas phage Achelous TaxID=2163982 RepID=A0A2S1GMV3_9CAUD|nr:terminase small subunit [Pseudomonas phage Achelous]AWD90718.1 small terminase subunit [Pseudomonas phage Achelous]
MIDKRSNKTSASEDELGLLHKLTTTLYTRRLQRMIQLLDEGADIEMVFDDKAIKDAGVWVSDKNGITCAAPEASEETELAKQLEEVKRRQTGNGGLSNVLSFTDGHERQA